jgi:hypothetical protein
VRNTIKQDGKGGTSVWSVIIGQTGYEICRMTGPGAEANARLTATAPDLLAALKAITWPNGLQNTVANLATARAAIAKAEGRA